MHHRFAAYPGCGPHHLIVPYPFLHCHSLVAIPSLPFPLGIPQCEGYTRAA
jgi:hypothetical protein